MKYQRVLISVFAAALTAGTCPAATVLISLNGNSGGGNQSASLTIDGSLIGAGSGSGSTPFFYGDVTETDGWHTISIDYQDISGQNGLTLFLAGGWASSVFLQSLDASGAPTNGLRGDFYVSGVLVKTVYGDSEGPFLKYSGGLGPWSGPFNGGSFSTTTAFHEVLTGKIYFGPDTNPAIDTITPLADPPVDPPVIPPTDPPVNTGDAAPEPASWWLIAAALPLMLFSKFRPKGVISHR